MSKEDMTRMTMRMVEVMTLQPVGMKNVSEERNVSEMSEREKYEDHKNM